MNIPSDLVEKLICGVCKNYLSRAPIFLQHDGVGICGRCVSSDTSQIRNVFYEEIASLCLFPCKNHHLGCNETVPFVQDGSKCEHDEYCSFRNYMCPLLGPNICTWQGYKGNILGHCQESHSDYVKNSPAIFRYDVTKPSTINYLIDAFQEIFILQTKVSIKPGKIFHAVRFFGPPERVEQYGFLLKIQRNEESLLKKGHVVPHGKLTIQEESSLAVETSSIIKYLGGWEGIRFTIQLFANGLEKCSKCDAVIPVLNFRDESGWKCEKCAPKQRLCENKVKGCTYQTFDKKCLKHELYFCPFGNMCWVCEKNFRGGLKDHYNRSHEGDNFGNGTTWRATETESYARHCLISKIEADLETAMCEYTFNDSNFCLYVCLPVGNEHLCEYYCRIRISHPDLEDMKSYTPDVSYESLHDWSIKVTREDFSEWGKEFDVCVDIRKHPIMESISTSSKVGFD